MPAKKRTNKRRPEDELSWEQFMDLTIGGRLGHRSDDGRYDRLWDSDEDRRAAYWAHRDRVLRNFLTRGTPAPAVVADYEPVGNDTHRLAVEYALRRITDERDRADRTNAKFGWLPEPGPRAIQDDSIGELQALLDGVPDYGKARKIVRRRLEVRDGSGVIQ